MTGAILRKYGVQTTIDFSLFQPDGVDLEPAATFAAGDLKVMKDEGAEANTTNLPTDEGQGYSLVLTATELQAARVVVYVVDQTATKVWLDTALVIETYGHASAQHAFDLDTATQGVDVTEWDGSAVATPTVAGVPEVDVTHWVGNLQTVLGNFPTVDVWQWRGQGVAIGLAGIPITDPRYLNGAAQSLTDLKHFADSGYDPATGKVEAVKVVDTVTTLTGHTAQTGDSFARLGAPAGASVSADIAAIFAKALEGHPAGSIGEGIMFAAGGQRNRAVFDWDKGTLKIYKADGTTVMYTLTLSEISATEIELDPT